MNKKCLECGHVFYFDFEIIFHKCDPAKLIETKNSWNFNCPQQVVGALPPLSQAPTRPGNLWVLSHELNLKNVGDLC